MNFYSLFADLLNALNAQELVDFSSLTEPMEALYSFLRIGRVVTTTYGNARLEALGRGEEIVYYDSGKKCFIGHTYRRISNIMAIIVCRVFAIEGNDPWSDTELDQIKLFTDTVGLYVSRTKILEAAERFAFYDDDGYPNIRHFIKYLTRLAQTPEAFMNKAALKFNLKHFSTVNQQIGRAAGSLVMQNFFKQIASIIDGDGNVCRMGGDNFVAFCSTNILNTVLDHLKGTAVVFDVNTGERIMVSATVGVYIIPKHFELTDAGDILDKIISAATAARTLGKEDVIFFNEDMLASKDKVSRIQRLFPTALENEDFYVFYQPKIDINTGELIGAEALCRWFHEGTLIPPNEFIPILEQSVDICKLDFYMLDHVCRDIKRWLNDGRKVVRVSVNLSRKHMLDIDLLEHIIEVVDHNDVPHQYIEIELTETTTDVEFRDLKRVVSGLQNAGISTSVDDFGMGYSSLNLLKEIPWNTLKVDRSFLPIESDVDDSARSIMFKYVVAMARELGLECIAEGVETQAQLNVLRQNQCDLAQGFLFDKPLPVREFEDRLINHKYDIKGDQ